MLNSFELAEEKGRSILENVLKVPCVRTVDRYCPVDMLVLGSGGNINEAFEIKVRSKEFDSFLLEESKYLSVLNYCSENYIDLRYCYYTNIVESPERGEIKIFYYSWYNIKEAINRGLEKVVNSFNKTTVIGSTRTQKPVYYLPIGLADIKTYNIYNYERIK